MSCIPWPSQHKVTQVIPGASDEVVNTSGGSKTSTIARFSQLFKDIRQSRRTIRAPQPRNAVHTVAKRWIQDILFAFRWTRHGLWPQRVKVHVASFFATCTQLNLNHSRLGHIRKSFGMGRYFLFVLDRYMLHDVL